MRAFIVGLCVLCLGITSSHLCAQSDGAAPPPWRSGQEAGQETESTTAGHADKAPAAVWNTVINPARSADVGAEVAGVLEKFNFDEGHRVKEGDVVAKLFDGRYRDSVERLKSKLQGLEVDLRRAEGEARIQEELLALKATTRQELLKAKTEAEVLQTRLAETKNELETAMRDLESCVVKAPFSGSISVRHKQPYEPVDRHAKLFSIVDAAKVYAVANIEEPQAPAFETGVKAVFVHRSGRPFDGVVERVNSVLDPKSKTKKVYCLIDNPKGALSAGMVGTLKGPGR